jgi:RHS repeat-associated protein
MRLVIFFLLLLIWGQPALAANFFPKPTIVKIGAPQKKWEEAYQYGFNGQMKVNEWAGLGNHMDYGDRGLDTRTGRWQTPDKLQAKYPGISPYAYCANSPIVFLDPDGNDVHVYLSAKPVGTTQIRLIQPSGDNGGAPKTVEVPLYQMTVTSDASKKVSTYFVTRDGPMLILLIKHGCLGTTMSTM